MFHRPSAMLVLLHLLHPSLSLVPPEERGQDDLDLSYLTITLSNTSGSGIESDAFTVLMYWGNHSYQCNFFGRTTPIPAGSILSCYVNSSTTLALPDNGFVDPDDSYRITLDYGGYNTNSDSLRIHSLSAYTNNGNQYTISTFCVPVQFNSSEMLISTNHSNDQCSISYPHKYAVNELTLDFFAVSAVRIDFNDQNDQKSDQNHEFGNVKPLKPTSFIIAFTEDGNALNEDVNIEYTLYWDEDIIHCEDEDSSHSDMMVVCTTNDQYHEECDTNSQFKLHIYNPGVDSDINGNGLNTVSPISIDWISVTLDIGSFKIETFCIDDTFESVHDDDDGRNGSCSQSTYSSHSSSKWTSVCVGDGLDSCNESSIDILFPLDMFTMNIDGNSYNLEGHVVDAPDETTITCAPTTNPTISPTSEPTELPTVLPTISPTVVPSVSTMQPTSSPTGLPTEFPTMEPTDILTDIPTSAPTFINMMAAPTTVHIHELDSMDTVYIDTHGPHGFGEWIREHTFNAVLFTISFVLLLLLVSMSVYVCYLKHIACFKSMDEEEDRFGSIGVIAHHHGDNSTVSGSFESQDALQSNVRKSVSSSHVEGPSITGRIRSVHSVIESIENAMEKVNSHSVQSAYERIGVINPSKPQVLPQVHSEREYIVTFEQRPFGMELSPLTRDRHNLYVSKVDEGSIAILNGIAVGDKIVALNGEEVEGIGSTKVFEQIMHCQVPLTLTFRRRRKVENGVHPGKHINPGDSGEISPALGALGVMIQDQIMDDVDREHSADSEELYVPGTPVDADHGMGAENDDNGMSPSMRLAIIEEKDNSSVDMDVDMDINEVGLLIDANSNIDTVGSLDGLQPAPSHESGHSRGHSNSIRDAIGKLTRSLSNSQKLQSIAQESVSESEEEQGRSEGDAFHE